MTKEERDQLDMEVASGLGRMYRYLLDNATIFLCDNKKPRANVRGRLK